jgi:His-Xaa-Ser system radical SAM maturase HxsC
MVRFKSIISRIVCLHVIAVGITLICMPVALYWLLNSAATDLHHRALREHGDTIARYLVSSSDGTWALRLPPRLQELYSEAYGRYAYAVLDDAGHTLFSSFGDRSPIFPADSRSSQMAFLETRHGDAQIYGASIPSEIGSRTVWVQVGEDLAHRDVLIDDIVADFFHRVGWVTLPILLVLLAIDIMCSQPPKDTDDRWILDEIRAAIPLIDKGTKSIGFTGGEPLLDWRDFIAVLAECRDDLPETAVHVLSNGRAFANDEVVAAWAGVHHPRLTVGIPVYSAVDHIHDYVVQARGAFDETVLGILKLKNSAQRVEVRVVLHAVTAPRIVETCKWLARNLPFVDHVALMGLENTGFAIANADKLWIDPLDYQTVLAEGVGILASARVNVSVYNLQRCVLDRSVWPYAVQSISDWKNGYVEECDHCVEKKRCSGFFTSCRARLSRGIKAIS